MTRISAILLLTFISLNLTTKSQDEEAIRNIIRSFTNDLSKLVETGAKSADKLMEYTNQNFKYERTVINIFGVVNEMSMDHRTISYMMRQMKSSNLNNKRVLGNLDDIIVRNNLAYASYTSSYELYESDRLLNKGNQFVNLIFRKNPSGEWKIERMNVTSVDDLTFKSTCICEIYENQGLQDIITETILPDGSEATIAEDKFSVDEKVNPRDVRHNFRDYLWASNGAIFKRNVDGSQGDQIGVAQSRQEMLLTLLKKEVYPDRCDNVIRKIK